jgi:hypothetical protein
VSLTGQWADTVFALERFFFLKVAVLGALSVVIGTALIAIASRRQTPMSLLDGFSRALAVLGSLELAGALLARRYVGLRDLDSATSLDRALWFISGMLVAVAIAGLRRAFDARRSATPSPATQASMGRLVATSTHALALAGLSLQLAVAIVR